MATKQDILLTPASGYQHIDALLAAGPDWNYLTSNGSDFRTTLYYSFAVDGPRYEAGVQVFNTAQQQAARQLLGYVASVTGISFAEVATSAAADLHFAMADVTNPDFGGVTYATYSYTATVAGLLTSYSADAYIYLDTLHTADPAPAAGSWWYQALLHELGHALGLKHPFEATAGATTILKLPYQDSTAVTVMSYTQAGGYTSSFGAYDLAALHFLYGGDGLRGEWGIGSSGTWLTGSPLDDIFTLPSGRVMLTDTGGSDLVRYSGPRKNYTITPLQGEQWLEVRGNGLEHLISASIEQFAFADGLVYTGELLRIPGEFIFGTDGADTLVGNAGDDLIMGGAENDLLIGNGGNDMLHGGEGLDTVQLAAKIDDVMLTQLNGIWTVRYAQSTATMLSVERLQLIDGKLALDLAPHQSAGKAVLVAGAALGAAQAANPATVGLVMGLFDSGVTLQQASEMVIQADWFKSATGGTDTGFVQSLLRNVAGETAAETMQNEYLGMLQGHGGSMSQAELFAFAALSATNQQQVDLVGLHQTGLVYL